MPTIDVITQVNWADNQVRRQSISYASESDVNALRRQNSELGRSFTELQSETQNRLGSLERQIRQVADALDDFREHVEGRLRDLAGDITQLQSDVGLIRDALNVAGGLADEMAGAVRHTNTQTAQAAETLRNCLQSISLYGDAVHEELRRTMDTHRETTQQVLAAREALSQQAPTLLGAVSAAAQTGRDALGEVSHQIHETTEVVGKRIDDVRVQGEAFSQEVAEASAEQHGLQTQHLSAQQESHGELAETHQHATEILGQVEQAVEDRRQASRLAREANRNRSLHDIVRRASSDGPATRAEDDGDDPLIQLAQALRQSPRSVDEAQQAYRRFLKGRERAGEMPSDVFQTTMAALRLGGLRIESPAEESTITNEQNVSSDGVKELLAVLLQLRDGDVAEGVEQMKQGCLAGVGSPVAASLLSCFAPDEEGVS